MTVDLDYDREYQLAADGSPFSNGSEGQAWMANWCELCAAYDTCPLILIAMLGRRPRQWVNEQPASLDNRYTCEAFHG